MPSHQQEGHNKLRHQEVLHYTASRTVLQIDQRGQGQQACYYFRLKNDNKDSTRGLYMYKI